MTLIAATTGQTMWYVSRGTGVVTLILLTLSVILGIVEVRRWNSHDWPRFVVDALHRNVSLVVLGVLSVHVLTSIVDGYAPISIVDAVIPFVGVYRPIWLGLGTVALDLLVAVAVTSVLRLQFGQRAWRVTHWLAYACWPVAVIHGLGTGSDTRAGWMLALTAICLLAVIVSAAIRATAGWPRQRSIRTAALATLVVGPLLLIIWLPGGPLGSGWAARAGTPANLLPRASPTASSFSPAPAPGRSQTSTDPAGPFPASLTGTVRQGQTGNGEIAVDLVLDLSGPGSRRLEVLIHGPPAAAGGVQMTSSTVTLATSAQADLYHGTVRALQANQLVADVTGPKGRLLELRLSLNLNSSAGTATGTVTASR